ncbi:UPF0764 protein C16orf89 homolog isoform X2 [Cylas formicarius]|uniref:UPF0764 protein C16orf89 homolog isoform X2 n=1 Tax=Cylas formicarius TaxID=197179 RepID=UPI002958CCEE|nr:UPF0764 protein C16orf89 homolog isoform X2 [Cylas formicarius]
MSYLYFFIVYRKSCEILSAFMKDVYYYGPNKTKNGSFEMLIKTERIIEKARPMFEQNSHNGNDWKFTHLVKNDMWYKKISFGLRSLNLHRMTYSNLREKLLGNVEVLAPNSDYCLEDLINATNPGIPKKCCIKRQCYDTYFGDISGVGYTLTHKLLLLQLAKRLSCMSGKLYTFRATTICGLIVSEVYSIDYYNMLDDTFDLFLEQVLLCGYEGFLEVFQNKWLYFILKSQRSEGCFSAILTDRLKTRMKKDMTCFKDGCNDHTTGLGTAVLAMYYNYIVKEMFA